ncbi:uncharacterized protein LOC125759085 [Rhipicephalus sanguineus]|uniref:uncharacterized protein LOC125759085 n=1 Tax=Rhipicephalus sanguineus TaxID=34632 RepID=UPI0020C567FC|nr:uncharacterized protein LOC125759085 [Rhipicephalus sanguineus]
MTNQLAHKYVLSKFISSYSGRLPPHTLDNPIRIVTLIAAASCKPGLLEWRECTRLIDRSTDVVWNCVLPELRRQVPKRNTVAGNPVHCVGNAELSEAAQQVLSCGPKFAMAPRQTRQEQLAMVRQVAGKAPESEFDHKEGGFAVLPKQLFDTKASAAVSTVFSKFPEVDLKKAKSRAIKLCSQFKLEALKKSISEGSKLSLDLFFSAKTHKPDCPLRVIVSESNTWQKQLASFLQEKLRILPINDPFRVKNSEEVIHFLTEHSHQGHLAFSIDIKDLYYSIPHDYLMTSVSECLDRHGATKFQNESGIHCSQFLELISMYLKSTFAEWNCDIYLQKNGICIGSCIAPILSDLYLAVRDKKLKERLDYQKVVRVFRYVDDFLVLLCYDEEGFDNAMCSTIEVFTECLRPLVITHEVPKNNFIRFLDLGLYCCADHVCWSYEPRGSKPVLPYHSAHSKLVKRAIARSCFHHALVKSCIHRCETSFLIQTHRLRESGYPMALLASVAEVLLKGSRSGSAAASGGNDARFRPEKVLVIPYVHTVSHNLRKLGRKLKDSSIAQLFQWEEREVSLVYTPHTPLRSGAAFCDTYLNSWW